MDKTLYKNIYIQNLEEYRLTLKNKNLFRVALLISMYFLPEPGGGATAAVNRAIILNKLGFRVFVLCSFPNYPSGRILDSKYNGKLFFIETIENLTVIRLRLFSLKHEGYIRRFILFSNFVIATIMFMPKILKVTGRINLVHSLAPILFSSISGYFYSKLTSSFFIYDVPDLWPEELIAFKTSLSPIISIVGKKLAKISYSMPDLILTISESSVKIIQENYSPPVPVYSLPIGVDPDLFPRLVKDDCRKRLIEENIFPKDLEKKFIVLYAGLISKAQRVENLIEVAQKLKENTKISIIIAGEGEDKAKIEKAIKGLDNVYLIGYQPRNIMPEIISSCDIGAVLLSMESIFSIAFPTKFYEYIACNIPVIAICRGELSNIIKTNNIGCAVDKESIDELVQFIKDIQSSTELFNPIKENVKYVLDQYSLSNISIKLGEILKKEYKD